MKVKATVTKVFRDHATVESERLSACEGCHKLEKGCSVCALMGGNRKIETNARNSIGAEVGDEVEIETETKTVLFYSLIVFVLPLVMMLGFYFAASALGSSVLVCVLCALFGFAASFFGLWLYSKFRVGIRYDAEIVSIIKKK